MKYLFTLLVLILVATIGINVAIAEDTPSTEVSKIDQADVTVGQFAFSAAERSILLKVLYVSPQYKTKYLTASLHIDPGSCLVNPVTEYKRTKNFLSKNLNLNYYAFDAKVKELKLHIDPGLRKS